MIDISQMEIKLKSAREDLINNFFTTTSRFNKNHLASTSSYNTSSVCNDQVLLGDDRRTKAILY
jgi:hypothetical protein